MALALLFVLWRPVLNTAKVWLLKIVIDDVVRGQRLGLLPIICATYLAIAALKGLLVHTGGILTAWLGGRVTTDLRQRLYNHLQALPLAVAGQWRPGDLLTRLTADTAAMEGLLTTTLSEGIGAAVTILIFAGVLLYLDPRLGGLALLVIPVLAVAIGRYTGRSRAAAGTVWRGRARWRRWRGRRWGRCRWSRRMAARITSGAASRPRRRRISGRVSSPPAWRPFSSRRAN